MLPFGEIELLTPNHWNTTHAECQTETLSIQQVIVQRPSRWLDPSPHPSGGAAPLLWARITVACSSLEATDIAKPRDVTRALIPRHSGGQPLELPASAS
jgi:hypothetical protein